MGQKSKLNDDLISRQDAIEAFYGVKVNEDYCNEYDIGYNDGIDFAVSELSVLPSAQPEKRTDKHTETHGVCSDCISKHDLWRIVEDNAYWVTYNETSKEKGMTLTGINQALNECPPLEPKPVCEDAISRADAIKTFIKWGKKEFGYTDLNREERFIDAINLLPTVEPERPKGTETMMVDGEPTEIDPLSYEVGYSHGQSERPQGEWIPVSERLPKKEEKTYWVCTDTEYQCECRWTNNRFGIGVNEWGWSIFDTPQYTKPIAWMPLPEPYREDGEE